MDISGLAAVSDTAGTSRRGAGAARVSPVPSVVPPTLSAIIDTHPDARGLRVTRGAFLRPSPSPQATTGPAGHTDVCLRARAQGDVPLAAAGVAPDLRLCIGSRSGPRSTVDRCLPSQHPSPRNPSVPGRPVFSGTTPADTEATIDPPFLDRTSRVSLFRGRVGRSPLYAPHCR